MGVRGFAAAHAWLAVDLLTRKERTKEEHKQLVDHLRQASSWDGLSSQLLAICASLQASEGNRSEALAAMERAAQQDSKYLGLWRLWPGSSMHPRQWRILRRRARGC